MVERDLSWLDKDGVLLIADMFRRQHASYVRLVKRVDKGAKLIYRDEVLDALANWKRGKP
jgi:hypothetical protein